jgi:hypothetical protein
MHFKYYNTSFILNKDAIFNFHKRYVFTLKKKNQNPNILYFNNNYFINTRVFFNFYYFYSDL